MILQVSSLAPIKKTARNSGFSLFYGTLRTLKLSKFAKKISKKSKKIRALCAPFAHFLRTNRAPEAHLKRLGIWFRASFLLDIFKICCQLDKIFQSLLFGDVGVYIHCGGYLSMSEQLLRLFRIHTGFIEYRCVFVPYLMTFNRWLPYSDMFVAWRCFSWYLFGKTVTPAPGFPAPRYSRQCKRFRSL